MGATFNTGYLENLILYNGSNNIGIGTSADATYKVTLGGSLLGTSGVFSSSITATGESFITGSDGGGKMLKFTGGTTKFNWMIAAQQNVNNGLEITPSSAAGGSTFSTPAVVVTSGGNVGIGTSSPTNFGAGYTTLSINGSTSGGVLDLMVGDVRALTIATDGSEPSISTRISGQPLVFKTNNAGTVGERLRIASTGAATFSSNVISNGYFASDFYRDSRLQTLISYQGSNNIRMGSGTAADYLTFFAGATEKMTITTGGNVLIGSTGIYGGGATNESELLVVGNPPTADTDRGLISFMDNRAYNTATLGAKVMMGGAYNTAGAMTFFAGLAGLKENTTDGNYAGALAFYTRANGAASSERMRITSGGKVNINSTSNTSYQLYVNSGGDGVGIVSGSGAQALNITNSANTSTIFRIANFNNNFYDIQNNPSDNSFTIDYNDTERMRITSGGYLKVSNNGVYNDAAGAYHEIIQTATGSDLLYSKHTAASPYGMEIYFSGASPNNATNWFVYYYDATTLRAKINSNGGLANFSANNVNLASDIRLKKDIVPLSSEWNKLKQIEVVNYRYKDSTDETALYGAIAQQVKEIYPELVIVTREATETEPEYYGLREQPFQWITTKVLQEAMTKIEEQQQQIEELKAKLN